jgi:hypothetical protein
MRARPVRMFVLESELQDGWMRTDSTYAWYASQPGLTIRQQKCVSRELVRLKISIRMK